jgi:uracil-DNA glycosylase
VFLLNAMLTVEAKQPSLKKLAGKPSRMPLFRAFLIQKDGVVFLLWGNFARSKKALIDETRHNVLESAHPSPLAG